MCLVVRMIHSETIVSGLNALVGGDFVTKGVDISLNLGLLKLESASAKVTAPGKSKPLRRCFASSRDYAPSIRNTCFSMCDNVPPSSSTIR